MPFIHIKSLPFKTPFAIKDIIENITKDFSEETGIELEHITVTWEYFIENHYAVSGKTASHQPKTSHPILVDLLAPDFNPPANIERMLQTIAKSIFERANIPINNIFINYRKAHSGLVFDGGEVVQW